MLARLAVCDLGALPEERAEREIALWMQAERRRRFDWGQPPWLRCTVHLRGPGRIQLSLSEPCLDGWSVAVLLTELLQRMAGAAADPSSLAATPADHAGLELAALASEETRGFWRAVLDGAPSHRLPRWPGARRRPEEPPVRRAEVDLPPGTAGRLADIARTAGVPLKSLLLAVHLKLLAGLTGESEVLTGLLSSGRPELPDGERILGLFLNPVALRLRLATGDSWIDLARRALAAERATLPHRRFPVAELARLTAAGDRGLPFDSAFNFTHFHVYGELAGLPGLEVLGGSASDQTYVDLTAQVHLDYATGELRLALDLRAAAFAPDQSAALAASYRAALLALAERPEARHDSASLLAAAERHMVLAEWNDTAADWPGPDLPLGSLVALQAARTPGAVAVAEPDGELTYAELERRSALLARRLVLLGLAPEQPVAVCIERSTSLVVALLAVLRAGGAFLPLDPSYPAERLAWMAADGWAGLSRPILLTAARWSGPRCELAPLLDGRAVTTIEVDRPAPPAGDGAGPLLPEVDPDQLAYVLHTSGSTGKPKAAGNTHRGLVNRLLWMQSAYGLDTTDRVLQKTPVSFDVSVWEFFWPLITGARLVLAAPGAHLDPSRLAHAIAGARVTTVHFVPSLLRLFLEAPEAPSCRSLRRVVTSGEALTADLVRRLAALLPGAALHNLYGPTEAAIDVTAWSCRPEEDAVPIGRPVVNTQVYLLDPQLQLVPLGTPGEAFLGGVQVGRGYLGRPDLTAERFVPDPQGGQAGGRLYRTGDLARRRRGGEIEFLGRADQQVKLHGVRIELGEVEAALLTHPAVAAAAAVVRQQDGRPRLAAFIVPRSTAIPPPSSEELRGHLSRQLPRPLVPTAYVVLSALPLTPSGKLDRRRLPSAAAEPPPESRVAELLARVAGLTDRETRDLLAQPAVPKEM